LLEDAANVSASEDDNILHHRSDMRWAGKTLNMFRPWSSERKEVIVDKLLHQQVHLDSPPKEEFSFSSPSSSSRLERTNSSQQKLLKRTKSKSKGLSANATNALNMFVSAETRFQQQGHDSDGNPGGDRGGGGGGGQAGNII